MDRSTELTAHGALKKPLYRCFNFFYVKAMHIFDSCPKRSDTLMQGVSRNWSISPLSSYLLAYKDILTLKL